MPRSRLRYSRPMPRRRRLVAPLLPDPRRPCRPASEFELTARYYRKTVPELQGELQGRAHGGDGPILTNAPLAVWPRLLAPPPPPPPAIERRAPPGDAKLLGAAGAWIGAAALPLTVCLAASCALIAVLVARRFAWRLERDGAVPFGPFLCLAVWIVFLTRGDMLW